jgi:hypothetical protein
MVTGSSGHPVPQIAALESSWSVSQSECQRVSGHPVPQIAALESSWSVSRNLAVLLCVFVYRRLSAKSCVCLSRSSFSR